MPSHLCEDCKICARSNPGWLAVWFYGLTNLIGVLLTALLPKCPRCGHPLSAHS